MDGFTLRFAEVSDVPVLLNVINTAFEIEKAIFEGERTNPDELAELLEKGKILLAEQEKQPSGSIYIELRGRDCYFGLLAVKPVMQGKGLGRFLVEAAENFARDNGCNRMVMRIIDQRKELPAFYEKLGYQVISEEPLPEGVETLVPCKMVNMQKSLTLSNKR